MRSSPSIVPPGADQDIYLVLDDFGDPAGPRWREADEDGTDRETELDDLLSGQFSNPARVVSFNTALGWSRDASEDIAHELRQRCADRGETPDYLADFLDRNSAYVSVQLSLPIR